MVILQWKTSPYDDNGETDVISQEELSGISTNEVPKEQLGDGYK